MSEVKLLYDSEDIFSDIGPTPFISRDVQNIYSNSEINLVDTLSLTGRIKRNYPVSVTGPTGATGATGATGSSYSPCESGFQGIKNVADSLVSKFSKNFKKLQLTEKIGDGQTKIIEEWENCIVKSISFDDNKWYDWVPYTIDIECFKKGYFENYGIVEPKRSLQLDVAPDNTINITLSCSCKGLNKIESGFQNAKNFVAANSNLLSSDLNNLYLTYSSLINQSNILLSESSFDNDTYWKTVNMAVSADADFAPDGSLTADGLACPSNGLNLIKGSLINPGDGSTPSGRYKTSIHVKAGTAEWVTLSFGFEKFRVTGATGDGTTATITYLAGSGTISVGTTVTVENINPSGYNGTFVVTSSTSTSISYANITTTPYVYGGTINYSGLNPYLIRGWFNIKTGQKGSIYVDENKATSYINHYISDAGNGWYKISITYDTKRPLFPFFQLSVVDSNSISLYTTVATKSLYIWKAAIENYFETTDLNSYNTFLISQNESLNRLTGEVSLTKTFVLQSGLSKSHYGILKYTRDMSISENGEVSVKIDGNHQGPLLARGLTGINSTDSTLEAIKYDVSPKDWYSIANDIYLTESKEFKYPNFSSRISQRVAGLTGTTEQKRIWSTFSTATLTFIKNPSCWIYGIDISGFVVASSESGYENRKIGILITPKHYLFAWHYPVNVGQTLYFLTNDNKVLNRTLVSTLQVEHPNQIASDLGLGVLNEALPDTIKVFKVLSKNYKNFIDLKDYSLFCRDQIEESSPGVSEASPFQRACIGKFQEVTEVDQQTQQYNIDDTYNQYVQSNLSPESLFFNDFIAGDSGSNVCLITPNDEMITLGLIGNGGQFLMIPTFIDYINKALLELGSDYSVIEYYPEDFSPLYTTPTNFSLQRDFSNNSVGFSLEFSNKQDNKIYLVDQTEITHDLITSRKCIQADLTIRSEIKCKKERWDNVLKYYNQLDFIDYVQKKWTKFGNTERLNFNEKDNSYSENQFEGTIQIGANFCNSLGSDCGCLQSFNYEYSFTPALSEIKASLPINSNGCHFIENMNTIKRAIFSIKGSLINPVCCSYEKTVAQLRNRVNQISNSLFYGENKIIESSQISKVSPAGTISFDFSWSAEKAIIIPENLL